MKKNLVLGALVLSSILSTASTALADKEIIGNIIGGLIGGAVGSQVGKGNGNKAAIIIGAIAGTVIGGKIGNDLDDNDRRSVADAQSRGLRGNLGQRSDWRGRSGATGSFSTTREGYNRRGEYCREYENVITHRGRTEQTRGVACTRQDGSWYEVQTTEVTFGGRSNGPGYVNNDLPRPNDGYGRHDGRDRDDRRGGYDRPSYRESSDSVVARGITRRMGGEWVRVNLRRSADISRVSVQGLGSRVRAHEIVVHTESGQRLQVREDEYIRLRARIVAIDLRLESMGGFADAEITVSSEDDRVSLDLNRY